VFVNLFKGRNVAAFVMLHTNNMNKCKVKEVVRMLKDDFEESARLHIQGCIADGDTFPEYLAAGDYDICYDLDAAALIRNAESYTAMSAISRASGINQKQLSHYANGVKRPRSAQLERIKSGLHIIGSQLLALC